MNWKKIYENNKIVVWAAVLAIVLSLGVLFKIKDEVTRFTLIMPLFAGFILFSILVTPDEELEDEQKTETAEKSVGKPRQKKSSKR